jgi:hypothetical protein
MHSLRNRGIKKAQSLPVIDEDLDLRLQLCYQFVDDSEDDGFCRNRSRAVYRDDPIAGRSVYHHKHCKREAVCAWLLRQQDVLCHIASAHWISCSAAGESDVRPAEYRYNFCQRSNPAGDSASSHTVRVFQR